MKFNIKNYEKIQQKINKYMQKKKKKTEINPTMQNQNQHDLQ